MAAQQDIEYMPIPQFGLHLRILSLRSGKTQDPICCSLKTANLDDEPTYDALSYAWGEPGITDPIEVDGVEILVTSNLERALRYVV